MFAREPHDLSTLGDDAGARPLFESGHPGLACGHLRYKTGQPQQQPAVIDVPWTGYEWTLKC
jgi:hypothetical protein